MNICRKATMNVGKSNNFGESKKHARKKNTVHKDNRNVENTTETEQERKERKNKNKNENEKWEV